MGKISGLDSTENKANKIFLEDKIYNNVFTQFSKDVKYPLIRKHYIIDQTTSNTSISIIATSTNVEGESTASYIAEKLKNIKVTRIASGIPIGGDLKFVDQLTMQKAIKGRYGF